MNSRFVLTLALFAGVLHGPAALAADEFAGVVTAGLTHSGDAWQVARTGAGQAVTITGGGRFEGGAGGMWRPRGYPLAASLVLSYNTDRHAGGNAQGTFSRVPLDGFVYYTGLEHLRIGLGASYIMAPQARVTVDGQQQTVKFKNSSGRSLELGYEIAPSLWTNLRLSSEQFKPKEAGSGALGNTVSHLSFNVSYLF